MRDFYSAAPQQGTEVVDCQIAVRADPGHLLPLQLLGVSWGDQCSALVATDTSV